MNITAETLTELFLQAPIPTSVATDGINGDPTRTGTNLLTYSEAQEIFEWMLRELGKPADINLPDDLKDQEDKVKAAEANGWHQEYIEGNGVDGEMWISPDEKCYYELPESAYSPDNSQGEALPQADCSAFLTLKRIP